MQIVFMGTPDFAVGALEALIAQGHEITAVVTQPDKAVTVPAGEGMCRKTRHPGIPAPQDQDSRGY